MTKKCPRCGNSYIMPEKHFHKDKNRKDGLLPICKICKNEDSIFYKSKKKIQKPLFTLKCENEKCDNVFTTSKPYKRFCSVKCRNNQFYLTRAENGYRDKRAFEGRFKRSKENPANSRLKWKEEDLIKLMSMKDNGYKFKEIANTLNRSVSSCSIKYSNITKSFKK